MYKAADKNAVFSCAAIDFVKGKRKQFYYKLTHGIIMRKSAKITVVLIVACMLAGCGSVKTEDQKESANTEQVAGSQEIDTEETSGESSDESAQENDEVKVITVTEEVKPVDVVFTEIQIGDSYDVIKEKFGECPDADIKVSMAGGKEYFCFCYRKTLY